MFLLLQNTHHPWVEESKCGNINFQYFHVFKRDFFRVQKGLFSCWKVRNKKGCILKVPLQQYDGSCQWKWVVLTIVTKVENSNHIQLLGSKHLLDLNMHQLNCQISIYVEIGKRCNRNRCEILPRIWGLGCFMWTINVCLERRGKFARVSSFTLTSTSITSTCTKCLIFWQFRTPLHILWKSCLLIAGDWKVSVWEDTASVPGGAFLPGNKLLSITQN